MAKRRRLKYISRCLKAFLLLEDVKFVLQTLISCYKRICVHLHVSRISLSCFLHASFPFATLQMLKILSPVLLEGGLFTGMWNESLCFVRSDIR